LVAALAVAAFVRKGATPQASTGDSAVAATAPGPPRLVPEPPAAPSPAASSLPAPPTSAQPVVAPPPLAAKPIETGTLNVSARPTWATVRIDGKAAGSTPTVIKNLRIGPHTVEALPGGKGPGQRKKVTVTRDGVTNVEFLFE